MSGSPWAWGIFAVYLIVTAVLAWRGSLRTSEQASFAIGSGAMSPWIAGLTLGACMASSSLFVIMPGQVYAHGRAALFGFTAPLIAGTALGLLLFSPRFQGIGKDAGALTVPHWLGERFQSRELRRLFGVLGFLQVAYLVLVVVGCANVLEASLGIGYRYGVVLIVVFVFGYTAIGGAWAHALTNSMQGAVMFVMALVIFGSGWRFWSDGSLVADLATTATVAPESRLFGTWGEVWIVPFLMGVALTAQPHLLIKAVYVRGRRDLALAIGIAMTTFAALALVLFAGAYARLTLPEGVHPDKVVARYLATAFPWEPAGALVSVAILAASMSTMDGLLVALSASVSQDVLPGRSSVHTTRVVLLLAGTATIALAFDPPKLVLILSQLGVFGLIAASSGPLLAGMYLRGRLRPQVAALSAVVALVVHFGLSLSGWTDNPGVGASYALACGVAVAWAGTVVTRPRLNARL